MMLTPERIIEQTKKWIADVVIGCNFCPFASKVVNDKKVHYIVEENISTTLCLQTFIAECNRLETNTTIETTILILPNAFQNFNEYLTLIELADKQLRKHQYEGIYQVASFHPEYCFAGEDPEDASNYTNRSPYPMLHILREESIEQALIHFPDPDNIPLRNIRFAREKGNVYMKLLRQACLD